MHTDTSRRWNSRGRILLVVAVVALALVGCQRRITDGDEGSHLPTVSGDGRYVAFYSLASNLVAGDTNGTYDVFVYDSTTGVTDRITEGDRASVAPTISADGRYVAFVSDRSDADADPPGYWEVFLHDRSAGTTTRITDHDGDSGSPTISADGRYVAYSSSAGDVAPGGYVYQDVFLYDRTTAVTARLTAGADGNSADAKMSADGRYVTFSSEASNLVPADTNGMSDVFMIDRATGATTRVTDGDRSSHSPTISHDGRFVAFDSAASNVVPGDTNDHNDVFVFDRDTGATTQVTSGDDISFGPLISGDGRHLAFTSLASDLVGRDRNGLPDVYMYDRTTGTTSRITESDQGWTQASGISTDGYFVTYASDATNLVHNDDDTNERTDVFLWNRGTERYRESGSSGVSS